MLFDLVSLILGDLPAEFRFMYCFGIVFVLYVFLKLLTMFIEVIKDFLKSL